MADYPTGLFYDEKEKDATFVDSDTYMVYIKSLYNAEFSEYKFEEIGKIKKKSDVAS